MSALKEIFARPFYTTHTRGDVALETPPVEKEEEDEEEQEEPTTEPSD